MISSETHSLVTSLLAEARARGVPLDAESITTEVGHPVLRVRMGDRVLRSAKIRLPGVPETSRYAVDVITVMGSGFRSSRMWPRNREGWFRIDAIVDHLVALVREELRQQHLDPKVAPGVPAAASGLHVLHTAGVVLGVIEPGVAPESLVARVADEKARRRIETHMRRDGLTDGDLRALGDAIGVFVGRCMRVDDIDPFEPSARAYMKLLKFGRQAGTLLERRLVLLLDRAGKNVKLADPAGAGVVEMPVRKAEKALKLAATMGKVWVGTASRARSWPRREVADVRAGHDDPNARGT